MNDTPFAQHLNHPVGLEHEPDNGFSGAAGGAACGDLIRVTLAVEGSQVTDAGFFASGCGAVTAAGSAAVTLLKGNDLFSAARVGADELESELGGLIPGKRHAVELTADALHRALGAAVRANGEVTEGGSRTLVAMSGGVDSAVAALLTQRDGTEAVSVTLELWADADNDATQSCCSAAAVRYARALSHKLGMPHFTLDLRREFQEGVVDPFIDDHQQGLTPNPCVRCNGFVRLDAMIDFADRLGAQKLATGHYARVVDDGEGPLLSAAADPLKDQTYMLAALAPRSLARMSFPLGEISKPEVRELATEAQMSVANKPESQDLCFLAGTDRDAFLSKHASVEQRPGKITDKDGNLLGEHLGFHRYTVGQRRGLGVASTDPLYVVATDSQTNTVILGPKAELATRTVAISGVELRRPSQRVNQVKLRYRSKSVACGIIGEIDEGWHDEIVIELAQDAFGVAPGQIASLMDGETLVGWGTIGSSISN